MAEYKLTIRAQQDLEKIWDYTVDEWSVRQAEKYTRGLVSCPNALADRRIVGQSAESIRKGYKKVLFQKHYIYYKEPSAGFIQVMRIVHISMNVENHL